MNTVEERREGECLSVLQEDPRLLNDPAGSSCSSLLGRREERTHSRPGASGDVTSAFSPLCFPLAADEAMHPIFSTWGGVELRVQVPERDTEAGCYKSMYFRKQFTMFPSFIFYTYCILHGFISFPFSGGVLLSEHQFAIVITSGCSLHRTLLELFRLIWSKERSIASVDLHQNWLISLQIIFSLLDGIVMACTCSSLLKARSAIQLGS